MLSVRVRKHGNYVTRYAELSRTAPGIIKGVRVRKGQLIGFVGQLSTTGASMLHLEMYSGTKTGSLTVRRNPPYQRRSDLLNSTDYLDIATLDITTPPLLEGEGIGRVNTRVVTSLNFRKEANTNSDSLAELAPGTTFKIIQQVTGSNYDANGAIRDDWYEIEYNGQTGFVAAFFVALEFQTGRVNSQVQTRLNLREFPTISATPIVGLAPGTTVKIIDRVTGSNYDANGTTRNDWYEVEYSGQRGFVAVFFIDLLETVDDNDPNAILFTYEPQGASDRTASQDGLPARGIRGVEASEEMAKTDHSRVMSNKEKFKKAGKEFNLPPALLAAIASRESRGGNVLDRNGWGDGGNAFGIMQVDKRFHRVVIEGGSDGQPHIDQATGILKTKLEEVGREFPSLSDSQELQTAVSRYNGGQRLAAPNSDRGTTGGDYMNDVWARGRYYATVEDWT